MAASVRCGGEGVLGAAHALQREDAGDRATRKADRIRERLDWEPGILNGSEPWNKPKGMHWRTFARLNRQHDRFVQQPLADIATRFGFESDMAKFVG